MLNLSPFKVLTFDCYGTLIDWEKGILAELKPWAARHGIAADDNALLEIFGTTEAAAEADAPTALYSDILTEVLRRMARHWNVASDETEASDFGHSVRRWPAFPDSGDALKRLQQHHKLVILSNVDHASFASSEAKLGVKFDLVCTAQDIGSYKPDLRNFRFAIAKVKETFGVDTSGILHVAQSLFHDIVPAKSTGLRTVWVNRRKAVGGWGATPPPPTLGEGARPDLEVANMQELAALREAAALTGAAGA
jgi:2-haloalkanoic acid dehalogenase type II